MDKYQEMKELVELEVKTTIGYAEAVNKKSFMTGVSVGTYKLEGKYKAQIHHLETMLKYAEESRDAYKKDLSSLACIINKHTPDEDSQHWT